MTPPLEPMDSDLASLLDTAKGLDVVTAETRQRIVASVAMRVATPAPGGGGEGENARSEADAGGKASRIGWLSRGSLATGATAFALGVGVGAMVRRPAPPAERVVYVDRVVPTPPRSAGGAWVSPSSPAPPPLSTPSALGAMHGMSARAPASGDSRDQLPAENALLDLARVAIAQGDGARALQAVGRHSTQFPNGLLREEREALTIKALHLVGNDTEARARASRFAQLYPNSLFLPAMQSPVDPTP